MSCVFVYVFGYALYVQCVFSYYVISLLWKKEKSMCENDFPYGTIKTQSIYLPDYDYSYAVVNLFQSHCQCNMQALTY